MAEKLKQTQNPRQAWITLAMAVVVSALFAFIVLPRIGNKAQSLEGLAAPDFALEVIHGGDPGNRIRLSDLQGKVVVLDFWASWCGPCKQQIPILDAFAQAHSEVSIVGVNTDDRREDAVAYAKSQGLSYPAVFDKASKVASAYGVRGLPTMVVVSPKGQIVAVRSRVVPKAELAELVGGAGP
ncbi:MAG: redoxin domain-containing protein [Polyangiaceae bacterium]